MFIILILSHFITLQLDNHLLKKVVSDSLLKFQSIYKTFHRALEVYSERLQPNPTKEHMKSLEEITNKLGET